MKARRTPSATYIEKQCHLYRYKQNPTEGICLCEDCAAPLSNQLVRLDRVAAPCNKCGYDPEPVVEDG